MRKQASSHTGQVRYTLLAIALAVGLVSYLFTTQSSLSNVPNHGDWWTDMAHIVAARNFTLYGFSSLRFGAVRDNGTEVGLPPFYYTHSPSFPAVMLGLLYRFGLSTAQARIFPLLVSGSALVAVYLLTRRMLEDWRAGIVASLALAASLPFRLLSDAFGYPSYDFAAKAWTILFITLGCLASGRRRAAWLAAAGAGAFATVGFSGFEMVPAIGAYSILFPLLWPSSPVNWKEQYRGALRSGFCIGAGILGGILLRLMHNALLLGGLKAAAADFVNAYTYRSSSMFEFIWEGRFLTLPTNDYLLYYFTMVVDRVIAYFPIHLLVVGLALSAGGLLTGSLPISENRRPFQWLGIIFCSEILWFLIFRQHTNMHVHTIYQLSLSASIAVAISATIALRLAGRSTIWGAGTAMAGVALFAVSLSNAGVKPYGNLEIRHDWTWQAQRVEMISSLTPTDAVVVLDLGNMDPSVEFFLPRTFVRRSEIGHLVDTRGRPWFLVTPLKSDNQVYMDARERNRPIEESKDFALFDMNSDSSPVNSKAGAR